MNTIYYYSINYTYTFLNYFFFTRFFKKIIMKIYFVENLYCVDWKTSHFMKYLLHIHIACIYLYDIKYVYICLIEKVNEKYISNKFKSIFIYEDLSPAMHKCILFLLDFSSYFVCLLVV